MPLIQNITHNYTGIATRNETLEGKEYLVVPMVMLTEGVHVANNGSVLYTNAEMKKTPEVWNHKPVVVYHPMMNGNSVSACDPTILEKYKVGLILNTKWDPTANKLRAEAWIDVEKLNIVDDRILPMIQNNQVIEVSTGVFTDFIKRPGTWNNEEYSLIATNYRPDHLAILPDQVGACSIADGAGLLQLNTQLSFSGIREQLRDAIHIPNSEMNTYIEDIYPTFFIYEQDAKLFKQFYSVNDNDVVVSDGTPTEVIRTSRYETPDGVMVANFSNTERPKIMPKEEIINTLVTNSVSQFTEDDRKFLGGFTEEQLQKMVPVTSNADETPPVVPVALDPLAPFAPAVPVINGAPVVPVALDPLAPIVPATPVAAPLTDNEYIAAAPAGVREVYNFGMATLNQKRVELVTQITANAQNVFTKEHLEAMPLTELQGIAALATNAQHAAQVNPTPFLPNYAGQIGAVPTANVGDTEALALPSTEVKPSV